MFEGVPARALPGVEDTRGRCGSCEDSAITSARFDRSVPRRGVGDAHAHSAYDRSNAKQIQRIAF